MIIEIQERTVKVGEQLLTFVKEKIMELSHIDEGISRADITFHVDPSQEQENKVCEILLTIFGDSIFAQRRTDNFDLSAIYALDEVKKQVQNRLISNHESSDIVLSTVDI
jgi:ribosomal subunit interface protein